MIADGVVNGPGEGEVLRSAATRRVAVVKGALPQLSVFEFTIEGPFDGPAPHTHDDHTNCFYVLEGELELPRGRRGVSRRPGTFVAASPSVVHTFRKSDPGRRGS